MSKDGVRLNATWDVCVSLVIMKAPGFPTVGKTIIYLMHCGKAFRSVSHPQKLVIRSLTRDCSVGFIRRLDFPRTICTTVTSRKNDRSLSRKKSNPSRLTHHSKPSFFRDFFSRGASHHFTAIILAGFLFSHQKAKYIISVKVCFSEMKA